MSSSLKWTNKQGNVVPLRTEPMRMTVDWSAYLSMKAYDEQKPYCAGQFPIQASNTLAAVGMAGLDAVKEADLCGLADHDGAFLIVAVTQEEATRPFVRFGVPYGPDVPPSINMLPEMTSNG